MATVEERLDVLEAKDPRLTAERIYRDTSDRIMRTLAAARWGPTS